VDAFVCGLLIGKSGDQAKVAFKRKAEKEEVDGHMHSVADDMRAQETDEPVKDSHIDLAFLLDANQKPAVYVDSSKSTKYTDVIEDKVALKKLQDYFSSGNENQRREYTEVAFFDPKFLVEVSDEWDKLIEADEPEHRHLQGLLQGPRRSQLDRDGLVHQISTSHTEGQLGAARDSCFAPRGSSLEVPLLS